MLALVYAAKMSMQVEMLLFTAATLFKPHALPKTLTAAEKELSQLEIKSDISASSSLKVLWRQYPLMALHDPSCLSLEYVAQPSAGMTLVMSATNAYDSLSAVFLPSLLAKLTKSIQRSTTFIHFDASLARQGSNPHYLLL